MNNNPTVLTGWGNFPRSDTHLLTFQSVEELKKMLQHHKTIARGLGRSYSDQSINEGNFTVDFSSFDRFISFDDNRGIVECEAGVSLEKIIRFLGPKGWFPMVCPGTKHISIGGAIANDIHGKDHHVNGSFVNCVEEITLMLADGRIVKADRENNSDLFWANFGGLGLLGFIISARLRLKRIDSTFFEQLSIAAKNLEEVFDLFETRKGDFNFMEAWIDVHARGRKTGRGIVNLGNHAKIDELSFAKMLQPIKIHGYSPIKRPQYVPSFALNSFSIQAINKVRFHKRKRGGSILDYDRFFFSNDKKNRWNRWYGKQGFIQYQFVVPERDACANIKKIFGEIASAECLPFFSFLKKMAEAKSGELSFPMEGYTMAIDFIVTPKLKTLLDKLNSLVRAAGGRVYLGKDALMDETDFKKMYPSWEKWKEIKSKYDPDGIFSSSLSRRIGLC